LLLKSPPLPKGFADHLVHRAGGHRSTVEIFTKAGHPGALGLAMLIPLVSFFVFLWFAFSDWPIEKKLRG